MLLFAAAALLLHRPALGEPHKAAAEQVKAGAAVRGEGPIAQFLIQAGRKAVLDLPRALALGLYCRVRTGLVRTVQLRLL